MVDAVEDSKQKEKQVKCWIGCKRVRDEIIFKIYSNEMLAEEQLSAVMDIIQDSSRSDMDEKMIAKAIVKQCFAQEEEPVRVVQEVPVSVHCLNKGKNWLIKIQNER